MLVVDGCGYKMKSDFILSGGVRRLQRHGLKANGEYGKVDNLHLSYDGNRITTVLEDAETVTLGNPVRIDFADGSYTENVYSATGEKLKATHVTMLNGTISAKTTMEYRGNVIYKNGKVDMVLIPGGYAAPSGSGFAFHYYTQDYLGNRIY